jgi:hypothetical protein
MATANREPSVPNRIAHYLLFGVLEDGVNLYHRLQEGTVFHRYVLSRLPLVVPTCVVMAIMSLACAAATVMYLGGTRSALVLVGMILAPFVAIGSLFVQYYVFFSWLENRALARVLHRKPGGPGGMPSVPWVLAALFLVLPLAALVEVHAKFAIALIVIGVLVPVAYARLDRA